MTPATGGDAPQKCEPAVRQMSFAGAVLQRSPSESNLTPKKSCKQSPTPPSLTRMPSRSRIQPEMSKWEMYMLEQSISPDPAARYVPLYGKLLWTYGLLFVCLFLMIARYIVSCFSLIWNIALTRCYVLTSLQLHSGKRDCFFT